MTRVENIYPNYEVLNSVISEKIRSNTDDRPFYVIETEDIYAKHKKWLKLLPRIRPYYAVKCNDLQPILTLLGSLGCSFDCASKKEIEQVLSLGFSADKIIYANPCKSSAYIKYAKDVNVNLMTFDNKLELYKLLELYPNVNLVLRIKGNEASSKWKLNQKFGADLGECKKLLQLAKGLGLNVVGVSFHNGSDCGDYSSYETPIAACKAVFDMGTELGFKMRLLDIGGGFPGHSGSDVLFESFAKSINDSIDKYFPAQDRDNLDIIAEPGRYYVASAQSLYVMVIGKQEKIDPETGETTFMYYLNEGTYGGFNGVLFGEAIPIPEIINPCPVQNGSSNFSNGYGTSATNGTSNTKQYRTILWGPSCNQSDCVKRDFTYPQLQIGQWLKFKDMGAYTNTLTTVSIEYEMATAIFVGDVDKQQQDL